MRALEGVLELPLPGQFCLETFAFHGIDIAYNHFAAGKGQPDNLIRKS